MSHNGDSRFDYSAHLLHRRAGPFQLHRLRASFLHQPSGVPYGILHACLEAHERHIRHHQRTLRSPDHGPRVPHHVVHGHRYGGVITQADHPQAVAHQDDRKARPVSQPGKGVVVSGDYGIRWPLAFMARMRRAVILGMRPASVFVLTARCGKFIHRLKIVGFDRRPQADSFFKLGKQAF